MSKVVIVSGGTYGLGLGITLTLARAGWKVVSFGVEARQISSLAENAISSLQDIARAEGLSILAVEADVTKEDDVANIIKLANIEYGGINALVNNAAIGPLGTILDTPPDVWRKVLEVNLTGPYLSSRAVIPELKKQGGGAIVNVGSGAGWGKPNMAAYASSKGGLVAFSSSLALDFFYDKIRVNTVIPGGGGIVAGMSLGRVSGDMEKLKANAIGTVAGRSTTGDDLGNSVEFLLSDRAEAISGTIVDVGCFFHQGSTSPLVK